MEEKVKKIKVSQNSICCCPDCGSVLEYNKARKEYNCTGKLCAFTADKNGNRILDNETIESNRAAVEEQIKRELEDYYSSKL